MQVNSGLFSPETKHVVPAEAHKRVLEAERLRINGKHEAALALCRELVRLYPDYVAAHHTKGLVNQDLGRHREAILDLVQAWMGLPSSSSILAALTASYMTVGAHEAAEKTLQDALAHAPADGRLHALLGELKRDQQLFDSAAAAFRHACELDPLLARAHSGLGLSLLALGHLQEAADELQRSMALSPQADLNSLMALASIPYRIYQDEIRLKLSRVAAQGRGDAKIDFILAQLLHKEGDYKAAWDHLVAANTQMSLQINTSWATLRDQHSRFITKLKSAQLQKQHGAVGLHEKPRSLFILGPPRSGKTTIETICGSLAGVVRGFESAAIENSVRRTLQTSGLPPRDRIGDLPQPLRSAFVKDYQNQISKIAPEADYWTTTRPGLIFDVLLLAALLPQSRFIFVWRNPDDVKFRIYMKMFKTGHSYAYDLQHITEYMQWYFAAMEVLADKLEGRVLKLTYEEAVADHLGVAQQIGSFCGLSTQLPLVPSLGDDRGCAQNYQAFYSPNGSQVLR